MERDIMELVKKMKYVCAGDVAKAFRICPLTARTYLFKMASEGKLKFRKVGRMYIFERC